MSANQNSVAVREEEEERRAEQGRLFISSASLPLLALTTQPWFAAQWAFLHILPYWEQLRTHVELHHDALDHQHHAVAPHPLTARSVVHLDTPLSTAALPTASTASHKNTSYPTGVAQQGVEEN